MISLQNLPNKRVALALSGGGDSMALALLCKDAGADFIALTVDHRLRPESADEALWVASEMKKRGIAHEILTYKGKIPKTAIEETARNYRYKLLADYCEKQGIDTILVAHNADEQAETFLLNLTRGSGVKGLSAMREASEIFGVQIHRPLLKYTKKELEDYLRTKRQKWITDPSNSDDKYARVRIRKLAKTLDGLGLSRARILSTIGNMQDAGDAIDFYANEAIKRLQITPSELSLRELKKLPKQVALIALQKIIGVPEKPIRGESLETALNALLSGKKATLNGRTISLYKSPK